MLRRDRIILASMACVLLPFAALAVPAQLSPAQSTSPDSSYSSASELMALGNDFALKYFDSRRALLLYNRALRIESANSDILWRISQAYVDIGEHLPTLTDEEKQEQLAMYEKALEFAERSVTADPENSMALTRRAIALNRVGLFRGFWETVGLLKDARLGLQQAIALDSTNHLAYFWLGKTHMRVIERPWIFRWPLGLGWGSLDDAVACFTKAIKLNDELIAYRLECARVLIESEEYEKARIQLRIIPTLPTRDEDDGQYRKKAAELFELIKEED